MNKQRQAPRGILEPEIPEDTTFKVIGLGGVGSIVARYLAVFLGAMDKNLRLVLVDGDEFELDNASRMLFSGCGNKAETIRDDLLTHFSESRLSILALNQYVTSDNIGKIVTPGDVIILATDNHFSRKQISDFCAEQLAEVALFSGGNDGIEKGATGSRGRGTFGNVQIFLRRDGINLTPPLTDNHPEIENPQDVNPGETEGCGVQLESTPQILFANLATASAILNALWLHFCNESLFYSEAVFDIGEALMRPVDFIAIPE